MTESAEATSDNVVHDIEHRDRSNVAVVGDDTSEHGNDDSASVAEAGASVGSEDAHDPDEVGDVDGSPHVVVEPADDIFFQDDILNGGGDGTAEEAATPREVTPVVAPRRPTRTRKQPDWMTSGEYVMGISSDEAPEWVSKANFLRSIAGEASGHMHDKLIDALINVIADK